VVSIFFRGTHMDLSGLQLVPLEEFRGRYYPFYGWLDLLNLAEGSGIDPVSSASMAKLSIIWSSMVGLFRFDALPQLEP